jgi:tRNA (guanine6-N2)-methyltransferase
MSKDNTYLLHCVPGLEPVVEDEMRRRGLPARVVKKFTGLDERTSLLVVDSQAAPERLLRLRTVEDIFVLAALVQKLPVGRRGLQGIRHLIEREPRLGAAAATVQRTRPARGRPSWRVVARMYGRQEFRRVDSQRAVEEGLSKRLKAWRMVADNAQVEFWSHLVNDTFLLGARISDARMRHRTYLEASRPASLKPTIAAAMILLTDPQEDDVFLDPMCGAGTLLIERAEAGRYAQLLGGDVDPEAVAATRENIGSRYQPIEIGQWDATRLPLSDRHVSTLACNLPFGKRIGSSEENRTLYPALLSEWKRVVRPGGSLVLLTSDSALLQRSLGREQDLVIRRILPVNVRGLTARILQLERK